MRFIQPKYLFGRAKLHKGFDHLFIERTVRLRVQLSVGKSPRAALAELDIRFRL